MANKDVQKTAIKDACFSLDQTYKKSKNGIGFLRILIVKNSFSMFHSVAFPSQFNDLAMI